MVLRKNHRPTVFRFTALCAYFLLVWTNANGQAPLEEDVVRSLPPSGSVTPPSPSWASSYSVDGSCYCLGPSVDTTVVSTPLGPMTVQEVCGLLGDYSFGGSEGRPLYNDAQCGNGAPSSNNEEACPGRVDHGADGCNTIGPTWNFDPFLPKQDGNYTWAPLMEDNTAILQVKGEDWPNPIGWVDSYSVGDSCYCAISDLNHGAGAMVVETPLGNITVEELCSLLGDHPNGSDGRPRYNDIQCGNGPGNDFGDEQRCPGRLEYGTAGCGYIGPLWNFSPLLGETGAPSMAPGNASFPVAPLFQDTVRIETVPSTNATVDAVQWLSSYSDGSSCYCSVAEFDNVTGAMMLETPLGPLSAFEICQLLGDSPTGPDGKPRFNDIQCGNGPALSENEHACPGRIEHGVEGCGFLGPNWDFAPHLPPLRQDMVYVDTELLLSLSGFEQVNIGHASSYSVGDKCYCLGFDEETGNMIVPGTPLGVNATVREVCSYLGEGPGSFQQPHYNSIQCGHGPFSATLTSVEPNCPGRVEYGAVGCSVIGPMFSFANTSILASGEKCGVPQFEGDWEYFTRYPIGLAEGQGGLIGNDLVIVSGFSDNYTHATLESYALNLEDPTAEWRRVDDLPLKMGITHAAYVIVDTKMYMCGGNFGGFPGETSKDCLLYNHEMSSGSQWSLLPDLPEARMGGAMLFDEASNTLIFAGGLNRPPGEIPQDHDDVWVLSLDDIGAGWFAKPNGLPYAANHISYETATDGFGRKRHFIFGGQDGDDETAGNIALNFEFIEQTGSWQQKGNLTTTRSHTYTSTIPISCGFLIAGGSSNEEGMTSDVSYYDANLDFWTSIGDLPHNINSPLCEVYDDYLYCLTGWAGSNYLSFRRAIKIV